MRRGKLKVIWLSKDEFEKVTADFYKGIKANRYINDFPQGYIHHFWDGTYYRISYVYNNEDTPEDYAVMAIKSDYKRKLSTILAVEHFDCQDNGFAEYLINHNLDALHDCSQNFHIVMNSEVDDISSVRTRIFKEEYQSYIVPSTIRISKWALDCPYNYHFWWFNKSEQYKYLSEESFYYEDIDYGMLEEECDSMTSGSTLNNNYTTTTYSTTIDNTSGNINWNQYSNITTPINDWNTITATPWSISIGEQTIQDICQNIVREELNKQTPINKEDKKMTGFPNFTFGTCEKDSVRMSIYGLSVKNRDNQWVSYDKASKSIINVDILNIEDGGKYMFKMPVAINTVQEGDIVIHNRVPMFVIGVHGENDEIPGGFNVIDPMSGEAKTILATKSPFGFDFMTKIVPLFDMANSGANAENPFGNMLPWIMMSNGSADKDLLMMMAMMNGGNIDNMNPMMMYLLMGDKNKESDMLPWLLMMNNNNLVSFMTPAATE